MALARFVLAIFSLWSTLAFAATSASYLDLHLSEAHYMSQTAQSAQSTNYTVYAGDLNLETQSPGFNYKLRPVFEGAFEASDEFYFGMPEAYVQPRRLAPGFDLTIGRQKRQWSRLDEEFNLGVWQPQLRWDYLAPKQEGLIGVFFDWSLSSQVRFSFFTSPLSIPDQGPNFRLVNGQFTSGNRWFSAPRSLAWRNSDLPFYFDIDRPSDEELFMHSSFGFTVNVQGGGPFWTQVSYAYKPLNQIHLGVEGANAAKIGTGGNIPLELNPIIHARIVNHNVLTWESGFDRVDDKGWISLTADVPARSGFPADYAEGSLNPALIAGFAYQHFVRPWVGVPSWLQLSYMRMIELAHRSSDGLVPDDVTSSFDRYPFREIVALDWRLLLLQTQSKRLHWRNRYTYSVPERGGWLSQMIELSTGDVSWNLGLDILGADVDPDSTRAGLFARYRANDRVFAGVSYVF